MKREVLRLIAGAVLLVVAFVLIFLLSGWTGCRTEYTEYEYEVAAGDTLDGLYYQYGGGDLEKWRYLVEKINGMDDACLYTGDVITILTCEGGAN